MLGIGWLVEFGWVKGFELAITGDVDDVDGNIDYANLRVNEGASDEVMTVAFTGIAFAAHNGDSVIVELGLAQDVE